MVTCKYTNKNDRCIFEISYISFLNYGYSMWYGLCLLNYNVHLSLQIWKADDSDSERECFGSDSDGEVKAGPITKVSSRALVVQKKKASKVALIPDLHCWTRCGVSESYIVFMESFTYFLQLFGLICLKHATIRNVSNPSCPECICIWWRFFHVVCFVSHKYIYIYIYRQCS